jgi:hypothetical protein
MGKWLDSIQGCPCSSQIFHAILSSSFLLDKRRAVGEKTVCSGFWIQKHASFSPTSSSEGEQLRFPPSDARLTPLTALCLPFSGRTFTPALRPRGHTPFATPTDLCPLRRTQIRKKILGFRLRSPLRWRGTVPAPPSNGFFHP